MRRHPVGILALGQSDAIAYGLIGSLPAQAPTHGAGHSQLFTCVRFRPPQHSIFSTSIAATGSLDPMLHRRPCRLPAAQTLSTGFGAYLLPTLSRSGCVS